MQFFPGTEEAWYRSLKEKITRLIDDINASPDVLRGLPEGISRDKIILVLEFILEVLRVERKAIVEDILYSPKAIGKRRFADRNELEEVLRFVELSLQAPREDFRLFEDIPCPIYGDMEVEYNSPLFRGEGTIKLNSQKNIKFVDPLMYRLKFVNCNADKILATTFDLERLIDSGVAEKLNAILVGLGEEIPRSCRVLLRRMSLELSLPVYVLTEATPKALLSVVSLIRGPVEPLPLFLQKFSVPHALWVGVSLGDSPDDIRTSFLNYDDVRALSKLESLSIAKVPPFKDEVKLYRELQIKINLEDAEKIDVVSYLSKKIP